MSVLRAHLGDPGAAAAPRRTSLPRRRVTAAAATDISATVTVTVSPASSTSSSSSLMTDSAACCRVRRYLQYYNVIVDIHRITVTFHWLVCKQRYISFCYSDCSSFIMTRRTYYCIYGLFCRYWTLLKLALPVFWIDSLHFQQKQYLLTVLSCVYQGRRRDFSL